MYTIGQVANILGISRDKLRYYEEVGVLSPQQNHNNNYRQYDLNDMLKLLSIELYRSIDLNFKTIKKILEDSSAYEIESVLNEKRIELLDEIQKLKTLVGRIDKLQCNLNDIKSCLNNLDIRKMPPIKILDEISDFDAFDEYSVIHDNINQTKEPSIIKSLKRLATFDDSGIISTKMLVTRDVEFHDSLQDKDILSYEKCLYTVIEDSFEYGNIMQMTFEKCMTWLKQNGYRHMGVSIIGMLLIGYHTGGSASYLEVYIPIEKNEI